MNKYYTDDYVTIYHGDNRKILPQLSGFTAVVTDPPYGLRFMGKDWDHGIPGTHFWKIFAKSCLPGAPLLAFGGTRTFHRLACAIEDAGWEIRDCIMWVYGSGFPKSHDISKAIDKMAGVERTKVAATGGLHKNANLNDDGWSKIGLDNPVMDSNIPTTEAAKLWNGYGTALKPAWEPVILAMKPLDGTFAENALKHGVAGLNVDGCRVAGILEGDPNRFSKAYSQGKGHEGWKRPSHDNYEKPIVRNQGRWPANLIHDGSDEVVRLFPKSDSCGGKTIRRSNSRSKYGEYNGDTEIFMYSDSGSAARFFYCAKASRSERNAGLDGLPEKVVNKMGSFGDQTKFDCPDGAHRKGNKGSAKMRNFHPTVKPLALMEYLLKLVTMPENNLIIDPFAGSGSTGVAAKKLGLKCVLIDNEEEYCEIAAKRCAATNHSSLPLFDAVAPKSEQGELF